MAISHVEPQPNTHTGIVFEHGCCRLYRSNHFIESIHQSINHMTAAAFQMAHQEQQEPQQPQLHSEESAGLALLEPELLVHALLFVDHLEVVRTGK